MRPLILGTALLALAAPVRGNDGVRPDAPVTYERDIRPILKSHCFQCHGEDPKHVEAKLDVRLRRLMVQGGKSGAAIVPGKHAESLLYKRIAKEEMPPDGKHLVAAKDLKVIARWIDTGAPTARVEPETPPEAGAITPEDRAFWSFQPISKPAVPKVEDASRVRTPVDAFLLARMTERKLAFSADADPRTLARRATYDLTGLPPTPQEMESFLADTAPDAYDRLIDRLLASPHYGERWGRHWLDVAGYADSEGYDARDTERTDAHKYRDYVIRSINADKPMDRFIREQLAGDEMVKPPYRNLSPDDVERLTATGFLRMAADGTGTKQDDPGLARNQTVVDTLQIVSSSILGMTVACAQCHDHRYDPISQKDYFRFRAIFEPAFDCEKWRVPKNRRVSLYTDEDRKRASEIENEAKKVDAERKKKEQEFIQRTFDKEVAKLPEELRDKAREARKTNKSKRTPEQKKILKDYPSLNVSAGSLYLYDPKAAAELKKIAARAAGIRGKKKKEEFLRVLSEVPGRIPPTHLHYRGDHEQPKDKVEPSGLAIVNTKGLPKNDPALPTSGRRLAFARQLTDGSHPLVSRVLVNRIWMHHFGTGLVATPSDFGLLGMPPTHPKLLDWLAQDFTAHGWKLKRFHKLLMRSTAYRQASRRDSDRDRIDPDNRLYSRMNVRRVEAEVLRDATLAVSGKLNRKMFGTPVPVMSDEVGQFVIGKDNRKDGRSLGYADLKGEEFRRSLYVQVRRSRPLAVLDMFDAPVMKPNCELRNFSTVAPQALMLMNSRFTTAQAEAFARRVRHEAGEDRTDQIRRAWLLAYAAEPTGEEIKEATAFVKAQAEHFTKNPPPAPKPAKGKKAVKPDPGHLALSNFCQALLSSNRFLYVD